MKIKRRTLEKIRNWFILFIVVALFFGAYRLYIEKDWFTIKTYAVVGVKDDLAKDIINHLGDVSSGNTLFIFPRNKILSYSHKDIVAKVSEVVPSRREITIHPTGLTTLTINITEFVPVMQIAPHVGVTKEGIVFETKRSLDGLPLFDTSSSTTSFKENGFVFNKLSLFDEKYIESLSTFMEKVSTILFPVTKIGIDEKGDVTLYGGESYNSKIFLTKKTDLDKGWSTLVSAIDTDPLKSSLGKEKEKLLYIDLRFGNKVFYKFREKELQNASTSVRIDDHDAQATSTPQAQ